MAEVVLRPMRPTDRAALTRLGHEVFAPFGSYEGALAGWLRHTQVATTVATSAGSLVGFAMVGPIPRPDGAVDAYLLAIGVRPDARRSGLGRRLLAAAVEDARKRAGHWRTDVLRLDVAEDNAAAVALFEEAGFTDAPTSAVYASGQPARSMTLPLR